LTQAKLLGAGQHARLKPGQDLSRRCSVPAAGDRSQQQGVPGRRGESRELGGEDGGQPVGQRQWLGVPAPARGRVGRDRQGQLDQCHRITGRLGQYLLAGPAAGRQRLLIEQPAGVRRRQRPQT
jgi:hypothetical protein